jgi:hypothetical protein
MKTIRRALMVLLVPLLVGGLAASAGAQEIMVEGAIAMDVVDRMPVDTASTFSADVGQLWCWTKITGAEGMTIEHVWSYGEWEWAVPLQIGGSPWRTYTSKKVMPDWTGDWTVTVRTSAGEVLETITFTVQ